MTEPNTENPFLTQLEQQIRGDVLTDAHSLGLYATDASVYQILPVVVVLPKDEDDVLTAIKCANEHQVSVLPRGGGTSLAGQTVGKSMVLDFSKYMNQLLELNEEEGWARIQPGLVRDELNAQLMPHGLHFAPDPATSSRANIGGMMGNNSSGTKSILYGKTVDHVLEMKIALADGTILYLHELTADEYEEKAGLDTREGEMYRRIKAIVYREKEEIIQRFPKVMRRVGGYNLDEFIHTDNWNLCKLLVGSEGTLATILEAKINLEPLPRYKSVCVVHFEEVLEAIQAVSTILKYRPAAVEILDRNVVRLSRENLTTQRHCGFIEGDPAAILIVEFYDEREDLILGRPRQMVEELQFLRSGYAYPIFAEGKSYEDVWTIRKKGLGLMLGLKGDKTPLPFIEDAGIPIDHLPEYIDRVLKLCEAEQTEVAMYAHASVGVIHVRPILDLRQEEDIRRFTNIAEGTFQLVQEYGGSWSGEHGDGLVRSPFNERYFGPQLYRAFQEIKQLFDPTGLMNPGKITGAPPMDQNLRYGKEYADQEPQTIFHYRKDNSFSSAVHMCTGVGECRKMLGGTMCPSFKATREEEHSTRGRANALRMSMSGQLPGGLGSNRLHEVMDLCISCKACKSECPSNVDMAKLKSEVQQMYFDQHGTSTRDAAIGKSRSFAERFSGIMAPVVNWAQQTSLFKNTYQKNLGFHPSRTLPPYARTRFSTWFKRHQKSGGSVKKQPQVVLFADTYLNYHEPQIGQAATQLLEDCGYEVILADVGCCQRPRLSHGLLREAKEAGSQTAQKLDQYFHRGLTVVVCEPSCASALTDDLPDLIDDEGLAQRLTQHVKMIDVFLAEEQAKDRLKVRITAKKDLLIHGHCHQKALYGTRYMKDLLSSGNTQVHEIDSGCCGMAGSFGYEKEHYELSEKIGNQILFPAVKDMDADTQLVACGFSCRHQIAHFTGKNARHWVELVEAKK